MTHIYTRRFRVRHYELDSLGHVNNAVYLNYLQQVGMEASADAGYDLDRYDEMGVLWLVRKTIIEYGRPATFGDELLAKTWVSDFGRVQSHREYHLTLAGDGETVARARIKWAFLNQETLAPTRIPQRMIDTFRPNGRRSVRRLKPGQGEKPVANCHRYLSQRRVQHYELDSARHVNNAVYLNWVEQAFFDASSRAGYPPDSLPGQLGVVIIVRRNEIDYFRPAMDGDQIEITSWVNTMARTHGTWIHEMRRAADQTLLARAYSTGAFLDLEGRPRRLPEVYQAAILRGGSNP
ncbi:MAG: acyl-[acyl-carrier-protein] thioesterase [Anaerolineae bacterium]